MDDLIPLDFVSTAILFTGSVLGKTWRVTLSGTKLIDPFTDRDKGIIYCFWHSHILPLTYIFRNIGVKAVVSSSKTATALRPWHSAGSTRPFAARPVFTAFRRFVNVSGNSNGARISCSFPTARAARARLSSPASPRLPFWRMQRFSRSLPCPCMHGD